MPVDPNQHVQPPASFLSTTSVSPPLHARPSPFPNWHSHHITKSSRYPLSHHHLCLLTSCHTVKIFTPCPRLLHPQRMLGWRKSLILGSSTCTNTGSNGPRPSVFCPTTEATAQATILWPKFSAGGFGGCTQEDGCFTGRVAIEIWFCGPGISGTSRSDRIPHISCNNWSAECVSGANFHTTAIAIAEVVPTRTPSLTGTNLVHTPMASTPSLANPESTQDLHEEQGHICDDRGGN